MVSSLLPKFLQTLLITAHPNGFLGFPPKVYGYLPVTGGQRKQPMMALETHGPKIVEATLSKNQPTGA